LGLKVNDVLKLGNAMPYGRESIVSDHYKASDSMLVQNQSKVN